MHGNDRSPVSPLCGVFLVATLTMMFAVAVAGSDW